MADSDPLSLFRQARDRFVRTAAVLSSLSLVGAAVSRLPTWEVHAPVEWLAGSLNVGFLPIFGPFLIAFGYAYLFLAWQAMVRTADGLSRDQRGADGPLGYEMTRPPLGTTRAVAIASAMFRFWCLAIPIIAYVILLTTYFDFCGPGKPGDPSSACTPRSRVLTLVIGTDGFTGFRPRAASIEANLRDRAASADKAEERSRLLRLADQLPWIYPPLQTWAYLTGLALILYFGWHVVAHARPPAEPVAVAITEGVEEEQ